MLVPAGQEVGRRQRWVQAAVVVAMAQHGGHEVVVVVLVGQDGMCLVPARAGVSLVGLREVSGLHAVAAVVAALLAFARHIDATSPC